MVRRMYNVQAAEDIGQLLKLTANWFRARSSHVESQRAPKSDVDHDFDP